MYTPDADSGWVTCFGACFGVGMDYVVGVGELFGEIVKGY